MIHSISLALLVLPLVLAATTADEGKPTKVDFTVYSDYFEKNTSGLKGDSSYLVVQSLEAFDKTFALRPPLMEGTKGLPLPDNTFDKNLVVAVIKRGNAVTMYSDQKLSEGAETLTLQYKAVPGKASSATFASPLIISLQQNKYKKVVFIENEKMVATVDVK
jgi:hypothetical protein